LKFLEFKDHLGWKGEASELNFIFFSSSSGLLGWLFKVPRFAGMEAKLIWGIN